MYFCFTVCSLFCRTPIVGYAKEVFTRPPNGFSCFNNVCISALKRVTKKKVTPLHRITLIYNIINTLLAYYCFKHPGQYHLDPTCLLNLLNSLLRRIKKIKRCWIWSMFLASHSYFRFVGCKAMMKISFHHIPND